MMNVFYSKCSQNNETNKTNAPKLEQVCVCVFFFERLSMCIYEYMHLECILFTFRNCFIISNIISYISRRCNPLCCKKNNSYLIKCVVCLLLSKFMECVPLRWVTIITLTFLAFLTHNTACSQLPYEHIPKTIELILLLNSFQFNLFSVPSNMKITTIENRIGIPVVGEYLLRSDNHCVPSRRYRFVFIYMYINYTILSIARA